MPDTQHSTPPPTAPNADALDTGLLTDVAGGNARLTPEQGLDLLTNAPLHTLGRFADARCRTLHGSKVRTYVIDRNINYTNVCTAKCTFCAFRRDATEHDAYTLEYPQLYEKVAELRAIGGTQILMQGGMNPKLSLEWYTELLRGLKERFPGLHVHCFSPPELMEFVNFFQPPGENLYTQARWVLAKLQEAGMDSLPGGGGEIFAEPVRKKIGLGKCDAQAWLTIMLAAHSLGMRTSATMMFGHIEGLADRVHHMTLLRQWQDKAHEQFADGTQTPTTDTADARTVPGGGYTAFISWPFQRENTPLGRVKDWGTLPGELDEDAAFPGDAVANLAGDGDPKTHPEFGRRIRTAGATAYLRTQAVSRLMLDNVYSIGSSWVTMGPHIGQTALFYGANDMGSVMMEENVVSSAGTTYCLDEAVLCRLVRDAGFTPAQRDNAYDVLNVHDTPESPDLRVDDWATHRAQRLQAEQPGGNESGNGTVELTTGAS